MTWKKDRGKYYRDEDKKEEPKRNLRVRPPSPKFERIPYTKDEAHTIIRPNELYNFIEASYSNNDEAEKLAGQINYTLDKDLSNENHKIFKDNKDDDIIIAFTGTNKNEDYLTDIALGFGLGSHTRRFKDSRELIDKVKFKYKQSPILAIGDSLGGYLAESVGDKVDRVITHNKASSLFDIGKTINPNQIDIRHSNDIISMISTTQNGGKDRITIDDNETDPYKAHSYDNIEHLRSFRTAL